MKLRMVIASSDIKSLLFTNGYKIDINAYMHLEKAMQAYPCLLLLDLFQSAPYETLHRIEDICRVLLCIPTYTKRLQT